MWDNIKKWGRDILEEPDNHIICPIRVMAVIGFFYYIGAHAWSIIAQHAAFALVDFSTGFGIMMTTVGAALKLKTDSKPEGQ